VCLFIQYLVMATEAESEMQRLIEEERVLVCQRQEIARHVHSLQREEVEIKRKIEEILHSLRDIPHNTHLRSDDTTRNELPISPSSPSPDTPQ
jgi:hypothetical protein